MIDLRSALKLYLVADPEHCRNDLVATVRSAIQGGVTMVQLRAKQLSDLEALNLAQQIREVCTQAGIPFLINDRVDIALAVGAEGVHLGVDDLPLEVARRLGGEDLVIGYSPDTHDQLRLAAALGASYLGIGPVFGTSTKHDAGAALGLEAFADRMRLGGLPAVAIGGINMVNSPMVATTGADGIAVVSAILQAKEPRLAARQLSWNS